MADELLRGQEINIGEEKPLRTEEEIKEWEFIKDFGKKEILEVFIKEISVLSSQRNEKEKDFAQLIKKYPDELENMITTQKIKAILDCDDRMIVEMNGERNYIKRLLEEAIKQNEILSAELNTIKESLIQETEKGKKEVEDNRMKIWKQAQEELIRKQKEEQTKQKTREKMPRGGIKIHPPTEMELQLYKEFEKNKKKFGIQSQLAKKHNIKKDRVRYILEKMNILKSRGEL